MSKINKKSLISFLVITFSLTIAIVVWMANSGLKVVGADVVTAQMILLAVMFIPALATIITRQFITKEGWSSAGLKWSGFKNYLNVWLLIPVLFLIIYIISYIFGYQPDWSLELFASQTNQALDFPASYMIIAIFTSTLFISPFINSVAGFGEELGWRGHLLPHLLPLGVKKALIIHSLIWGLWHVPFVLFLGFGGYDNIWIGSLFFLTLITFLGIYIGYLRLKSGSTLLASWAHGVFNAQSYGVWVILFPQINHFVAGLTGVVGIAVMWVLAWYSFRLIDKDPHLTTAP